MLARANHQAILLEHDTRVAFNWAWLRRGVLVILIFAVLGWLALLANDPQTLPIKKIHALGKFIHVNETMLRDAVAAKIDGGYFKLDVDEMKNVVEKIAWVDQASVRRVWPDTLAIQVQEQQALAKWATGGLVNVRGSIFKPETSSYPKDLPLFTAPVGMQEKITQYYLFAKEIFSTMNVNISEVRMDARRAVSLRLDNGIEVMLGRDQIESRLQRLARIYTKVLATRAIEIARLDLRYSNGLAVGWRKPPVN
jgi:cell division protein FtsQ